MGTNNRVPKGTYETGASPAFLVDREIWEATAQAGLRRIMRERGMSVRDLATHMGLSSGAIKHRLYGHKKIGWSELLALCSSLDVHPMCVIDPTAELEPFPDLRHGPLASLLGSKRRAHSG